MSSGFTKNFEIAVDSLATDLNVKGTERQTNSRFSEVPVSAAYIHPGDIVFFKYTSEVYGEGEHLTMLISNKRSDTGIYLGKRKSSYSSVLGRKKHTRHYNIHRKYMAAVKLNNIWSETAALIKAVYTSKNLKYVKKPLNSKVIGPQPWIALVGRNNYRSYIVNFMRNVNKLNNPKEKSVE